DRPGRPVGVCVLPGGLWRVAFGDLLGRVLGQVADAPVGVLGPGEYALGVEPGPEAGHMLRLISWADRVERIIPGLQDFAGRRVEVVAGILIPDRQLVPREPNGIC